ncbi:nucleotide pyrophosphohydrolase [Tundrisphaera sp. TA3]|uniref:nucleotide pyrophosphohydrolase n=1 Tax=Tundrisphaera sp. TA3 TaxID=3435775 RepID=UPI003EB8F9C3
MDDETTIGALKALVLRFARERDWEQFHSPKDLGLALASEVGELLDHFRYRPDAAIRADLADPDARREVAHEMADCLWVLLRLADVCGVDLASAIIEKVDLAAIKYPIERSRGRADKYTAYRDGPEPDRRD